MVHYLPEDPDGFVDELEQQIRDYVLCVMPTDPSGELDSLPLNSLLLTYGNWRSRFVHSHPRAVHLRADFEPARRPFDVAPGQMGENVVTGGLDLLGLPRDTLLQLGEHALIQITGLRNPCAQIDVFRPGLLKAVVGRGQSGDVVRRAGVMAIVVHGGAVRPGDGIQVRLPAGLAVFGWAGRLRPDRTALDIGAPTLPSARRAPRMAEMVSPLRTVTAWQSPGRRGWPLLGNLR